MESEKLIKPVYYCNIAKVEATSVNDFKLGFGTKKGPDISDDDMEFFLYTSPQHLKALILLLTEHLRVYEKLFGVINLEPDEEGIKALGDKIQIVKQQ